MRSPYQLYPDRCHETPRFRLEAWRTHLKVVWHVEISDDTKARVAIEFAARTSDPGPRVTMDERGLYEMACIAMRVLDAPGGSGDES